MKQGLLLINLGTPNSPETNQIRAYLKEFLTDKRVIDLPKIVRYLLVYGVILPFRPKTLRSAYQAIWTEAGSPLMAHSRDLAEQLQQELQTEYQVVMGMRYGNPSINQALDQLKECQSITVLPLYPQYSSAATGSSLEEVMRLVMSWQQIPSLKLIRDFYLHPAYIKAQAHRIKPHLSDHTHLLFSYHGLPTRQIIRGGCEKTCPQQCPIEKNVYQKCYKAQCYQTSLLLGQELGLNTDQYSSSFQSRLGKTPWIEPYTPKMLINLAEQGIKHLAIACPSFTSDCLETIEEIGIQAKKQWLDLGGECFTLIPCMNKDPLWIKAIVEIIQS